MHGDHVSKEKRILSETLLFIFHVNFLVPFQFVYSLSFFRRLSTLANYRVEASAVFEFILHFV